MNASGIRDLARQLLAYEASAADKLSEEKVSAVVRVCERLRRSISALAGGTGYSALLSRALVLAKAEAPGLSSVRVNRSGSLEGIAAVEPLQNRHEPHQDQNVPGRATSEAAEGEVAIVAQLLGLLIVFIGEHITVHVVEDAWPAHSPVSSVSGRKEER